MADPPSGRLSDAEVEQRLDHLNALLEAVEAMPGTDGDTAREAVAALAEIYGEALGRMMTAGAPDLEARSPWAADPLVAHLLVLHGLQPAAVLAPTPSAAFIPVESVRVKARP